MDPQLAGRLDHPVHADLAGEPDGHRVARLGQRLAKRDRTAEPVVVVRDPLHAAVSAQRHADGLVGDRGVEVESLAERGEVEEWLERRPRLAPRVGGAIVVRVTDGPVLVDLPAARLGEDRTIRVPQYDH